MAFRPLWLMSLIASASVALVSSMPAVKAAPLGPHNMSSLMTKLEATPYDVNYVAVPPDQPTALDLAPPYPAWPSAFHDVVIHSADGTPFYAEVAVHSHPAPAVVLDDPFDSNGKNSLERWAIALYGEGFQVVAPDWRDLGQSTALSHAPQTFGWKETQDLIAAVRYIDHQPHVTKVGAVGFSEGAQNALLAAGFTGFPNQNVPLSAVLAFSPPADQNTQQVDNPATTAALTEVVVGSDPCSYLAHAAAYYRVSSNWILNHERAYVGAQQSTIPTLAIYAGNDPLVPAFEARIMASRTNLDPAIKATWLLSVGDHAYFPDRWWQEKIIATYMKYWLAPNNSRVTTNPNVVEEPGVPGRTYSVDLSHVTKEEGNRLLAPVYACTANPYSPTPPPGPQ